MNSASAARRIFDSSGPDELFGSSSRGRARRVFRQLVTLVHPDLADGIDADTAQQAAVLLNLRWAQFTSGSGNVGPSAAPHVVGQRGTYLLNTEVWADATQVAYATNHPNLIVVIERHTGGATAAMTAAASLPIEIRENIPVQLDGGLVDGRRWVAYRLPDSAVSLREVLAANGPLDGRDWAWMARRILGTLAAAKTPHGALDLHRVFIVPADHRVVIAGWTGTGERATDTTTALGFWQAMLRDGTSERRQQQFAEAAARDRIPAYRALAEYDLLLGALYGPRRFRPFNIAARAA